ncbi:unnamed protein product [Bemisia tabaci]|uniref:LysM domain-containing protein n=1 Tax=Bemisia tabaci TaxID=7038 RepID=A0A9P0A633_BEMTA|nr:PREDICTED: lysM and putative peptidoglycan-binding domain-containing protein 2 [Bemisia tabaci]CAH0385052.1 unnamed protein product [Bemisia tabaci]
MDERKYIRGTSKSFKSYGSTSSFNAFRKPEQCIKHIIEEKDTLQGIALKYGVTTEQIRRLNKLWTNDSLFLRKSLLIPVSNENVTSPSNISLFDNDPNSPFHSSAESQVPNFMTSSNSYPQSLNSSSKMKNDQNDTDEIDFNSYLCRIDSDIANTKNQVQRTEGNSSFSGESLRARGKIPMSRFQLAEPNDTSYNDVAVITSHGRRVRSSLERLQQKQDELFQL